MPDNNSFKRQDDNSRPDFEERKKAMTQFSDAKQVKKKDENTAVKWLRNVLFSGRTLKEILKDVAENQFIPQAKDNLRNILVSIIDLKLYKDSKPSSSTTNTIGNFVTNYVSYSNKQAQQKSLEENKKKEAEVIQSGYETPAFREKRKAEDFIRSLHAYVTTYATLSVQDLAWMQGKTIDYTWDKYGWEADEIFAIKAPTHISNPDAPWIVDLPKAHVLS